MSNCSIHTYTHARHSHTHTHARHLHTHSCVTFTCILMRNSQTHTHLCNIYTHAHVQVHMYTLYTVYCVYIEMYVTVHSYVYSYVCIYCTYVLYSPSYIQYMHGPNSSYIFVQYNTFVHNHYDHFIPFISYTACLCVQVHLSSQHKPLGHTRSMWPGIPLRRRKRV